MIQEVVFKMYMNATYVCDIVTEHPDYCKYNEYGVKERDIYDKMMDITYAMNHIECRNCLFEVA